jgi:hypothetical protein
MTIGICCILGLLSPHKLQSGYEEMGCSTAIIFDDILNGNIKTDNSSFFTGLTTLRV